MSVLPFHFLHCHCTLAICSLASGLTGFREPLSTPHRFRTGLKSVWRNHCWQERKAQTEMQWSLIVHWSGWVQFSLRWYLSARKSPYALHPVSLRCFPLVLPLSTLLCSRRSMVWCPWLCACRYCLKLLNTSDLPRSKPLVRVTLPASLSALSFAFSPACPGRYTQQLFSKVDVDHQQLNPAGPPGLITFYQWHRYNARK